MTDRDFRKLLKKQEKKHVEALVRIRALLALYDGSLDNSKDEALAREELEYIMWENQPVCPHCEYSKKIYKLTGKSHRPGLYKCAKCRKQFTVTTKTFMNNSHAPLRAWVGIWGMLLDDEPVPTLRILAKQFNITPETACYVKNKLIKYIRSAGIIITNTKLKHHAFLAGPSI